MNPEEIPIAARLDYANRLAASQTASAIIIELEKLFRIFTSSLKPDEDVAVRLSLFGNSLILIDQMMAVSPSLIVIFGKDESGKPVTVAQHVSQFSVMLCPVKKNPPSAPRRPMGFHTESDAAP